MENHESHRSFGRRAPGLRARTVATRERRRSTARRVRPSESVRNAGLHDQGPLGILYSIHAAAATSIAPRFPGTVAPRISPGVHYYAVLDLPAGAVIDYIGVNTATTVSGAMGFTLHFRDHLGGSAQLASATSPAPGRGIRHGLRRSAGIVILDNHDREFSRRRDRARSGRLPVLRLRRGLVAPERVGSAVPRRRSVTCRMAIRSTSSSRRSRPRDYRRVRRRRTSVRTRR